MPSKSHGVRGREALGGAALSASTFRAACNPRIMGVIVAAPGSSLALWHRKAHMEGGQERAPPTPNTHEAATFAPAQPTFVT
jgi:hypothetical protein